MKKFVFCLTLLSLAALSSTAQLKPAEAAEVREIRSEILKQQRLERIAESQQAKRLESSTSAVSSLTDAEVGEASSFNKGARFFGTATAGFVLVEPSCDPVILGFPLGPDDRCLEITNPAITTIGTFNNIGRITIPAKQADNVIYIIANHTTASVLQNSGIVNVSALANYTPSITIESEALNDPAAIDPNTGLPMNGSFTTSGLGTRSVNQTMFPSTVEVDTLSFSRANTNGLSRTYWAALGLPASVIDEIYKKPLTIKLNVTVRARHVASGTYLFSLRMFAN